MIDKGAIQAAHPEWGIVDAIPAIDGSGGIWAVNAQGAVFALDANGNPSATGAKYLGGYNALPEAQRQGTRSFVGIRSDPLTGGYTLISNQVGQNYNFAGSGPIDKPVDTSTQPAPTKAIDFTDADLNQLTATLKQFGLGDFVDEAWKYYKDPQRGAGDTNATLAYLPTTQLYKDHFPGLEELAAKGNAWTPAQWNTYYNSIQDAAVSAGIPAAFVERGDIGKMLAGGVSRDEALGRINAAGQSVLHADPFVIAKARERGMSDGDLTAWFLDPDKAMPLIQRQAELTKAQISAAAQRTGYDPNLSTATADTLFTQGVDEAAANQGFGQLYGQRGLFANTVGETMAGQDITQGEQLGATFGNDAVAQAEIEARRKSRQANFQGGGGAAGGGGGKTGLG